MKKTEMNKDRFVKGDNIQFILTASSSFKVPEDCFKGTITKIIPASLSVLVKVDADDVKRLQGFVPDWDGVAEVKFWQCKIISMKHHNQLKADIAKTEAEAKEKRNMERSLRKMKDFFDKGGQLRPKHMKK